MNSTFLRRTCVSLATAALLAVTLAPMPAQAAISPAASDAGSWLGGQLTGGLIHNDQFGGFDDYGLTLDVLMGLQEAKTQGSVQADILAAMGTNIKNYVFNYPNTAPGDGLWAGSSAKALVAVQGAHKDPKAFGGVDLVGITESTVVASGADKGRLKDKGIAGFPDTSVPADYSNLLYQAFGLQGLAQARSTKVASVRNFLLKQQCGPGYFRLYFNECKPDVDATAIAVRAMTAARADGVTGMDTSLKNATAWLLTQQDDDGSFGGGESTSDANSNSTGLAASALALRGERAAASKAAAWIAQWQIDKTAGGKLSGDEGAIGYNSEALAMAKTHGIDSLAEDQWRRATSQAILGLIHLDTNAVKTIVKTKTKTVVKVPKPVIRTKIVKGANGAKGPQAVNGGNAANVVVTEGAKIDAEATTAQGKLGQFLAAQLSNGDHIEVKDGKKKFTDYDLTADTVLALRMLGEQPKFADRTTTFLFDKESLAAYAHGAPYEKGAVYAEPVATLIVAGTLAKKPDARKIAALGGDLAALQDDKGSFIDDGKYADESNSTQRHVLATLAATMAGEEEAADKAVAYLDSRQCDDGGFAVTLAADCKTGDPASTGWALQALNAVDSQTIDKDALLSAVPEGWSAKRTENIGAAAMSLQKTLLADGTVSDESGDTDLAATAAVAAGRYAVGLSDMAAGTVVASAQLKDGGLPTGVGGKKSDLAVSAAGAPALAGASWLSTAGTGLAPGVSLPLVSGDSPSAATLDSSASTGYAIPSWLLYAALALLALLVLAALGFGVSRAKPKTDPAHKPDSSA